MPGAGGRSEINVRDTVLHRHRIAGHADRHVSVIGPGGDVVAPAVPGARHDGAVQVALTEGPAPVGTRVVDGVEGAGYVEEGQRPAARVDARTRSHREILAFSDPSLG